MIAGYEDVKETMACGALFPDLWASGCNFGIDQVRLGRTPVKRGACRVFFAKNEKP